MWLWFSKVTFMFFEPDGVQGRHPKRDSANVGSQAQDGEARCLHSAPD